MIPTACLGVAAVSFQLTASLHARPPAPASPLVYYVSPAGRDSWSGKRATPDAARSNGPFATLEAARDAIRAARQAMGSDRPATVKICGGRYELQEPFRLEPEDSGVSYVAYGGAEPVLSGGVRVTGWHDGGGGLWKAPLPRAPSTGPPVEQLFIDGRRAARARLPVTGYYTIANAIEPVPGASGYDSFIFRPGDLSPSLRNLSGIELVCLHIWSDSRLRIASIDPRVDIVRFTGPTCSRAYWSALARGNRYYLENAWEGLSALGCWYLDARARELYYRPLPGQDMRRAEVIAPRLERLVDIAGDPAQGGPVRDVVFRGISFQHSEWTLPASGYSCPQAEVALPGAIHAEFAIGCRWERCEFVHMGAYAVDLGRGCQGDILSACRLYDLGAGGVKIGETVVRPDARDIASGNVVEYCDIAYGGEAHPAGEGVWVGQGSDNRIAHNRIHDLYYTAVSLGWTWGYGATNARDNRVEYNEIYDIGRGRLSDMGGIYTLGVAPGTVLAHNVIHDVLSYDYGGWGIYFDEGSSHITATHNLVYRTKSGGFHQHYGANNLVEYNLFALGTTAQIRRTRAEDHLSFTFRHNLVYWTQGVLLDGAWDDTQHFIMDDNFYWNPDPAAVRFHGLALAAWQRAGEDVHSRVADPLFVAPERGDFRLRRGSPVATWIAAWRGAGRG